jgi:anti-anti-sigma factor
MIILGPAPDSAPGPAPRGSPGDAGTVALPAGPTEPALTVEADMSRGTATVVISGELDLTTAPLLGQHLARILGQNPQRLVFRMDRVRFIDCAAARLIAGTSRSLPAGQRPLIRPAGAAVRRILALTGLDARCEVEG